MYGFFNFCGQINAQFVTWYHQTISIIQTPRTYLGTFTQNPPGRKPVLKYTKRFEEHETVENAQAFRRPAALSDL